MQVQPRRADGTGVEQRPRQPVHRVAAIVLRHAHHQPRVARPLPHVAAGGDRTPPAASPPSRASPAPAPSPRSRGWCRVLVVTSTASTPRGASSSNSATAAGLHPEVALRGRRQGGGVVRYRVAHSHQPILGQAGAGQLGQTLQVTVPHAATAHDPQCYAVHLPLRSHATPAGVSGVSTLPSLHGPDSDCRHPPAPVGPRSAGAALAGTRCRSSPDTIASTTTRVRPRATAWPRRSTWKWTWIPSTGRANAI